MDRSLEFDVILNYTFPLDGKSEHVLFDENSIPASSSRITSLNESELVKWMLESESRTECFFGRVLLKDLAYQILQTISTPIIQVGEKPGDTDILVYPQDHPDLAIAFEVKRVKVNIDEDDVENINKDTKVVKKGIKQANQLRKLGFHQTYLVVIIVTDGKNRTSKDIPFRYADSDRIRSLYDLPKNKKLHPDVGVIYVQIVEPTSASMDYVGHFTVRVDKKACELEQALSMISRVKQVNDFLKRQRQKAQLP